MAPTPRNTSPLWRPTTISHGAISITVATTEPRPRLTNTIGSVQHTSVVSDDARPTTAGMRGRMAPPFLSRGSGDNRQEKLDQQAERVEMGRVVGTREVRRCRDNAHARERKVRDWKR